MASDEEIKWIKIGVIVSIFFNLLNFGYTYYENSIEKEKNLPLPTLNGKAECKQWTSRIFHQYPEYNFSVDKNNDYYADIFSLKVQDATAKKPTIKVEIPKEINISDVKSFPKNTLSIENHAIIAKWEEISIENNQNLVILYDIKYKNALVTGGRTYSFQADNSPKKISNVLTCEDKWDYFDGFK